MVSTLAGLACCAASAGVLNLTGQVGLRLLTTSGPVARAAADVARDLGWVLGTPGKVGVEPAAITIAIDPAGLEPEGYRITVSADRITIVGADELGAIYGLYRLSRDLLGVEPLWYWKQLFPARRERLILPAQEIASEPAAFRYRGWFINDEDLLTAWHGSGGVRPIDYPFYHQVTAPDIIEAVCETLLRCGGNLLIPASFVNVLNPPEAALVERTVARGLSITQHHVEPLGVSHFGFEQYWAAQGEPAKFSFATDRERVLATWSAYVQRWWELAGDKVIWQLGLRGRGDTPYWKSDPAVGEAQAGQLISEAIAAQWELVRRRDPRPLPPATQTLWLEGSQLMSQGALTLPEDVWIVFADDGHVLEMQADFETTAREPGRRYGAYYHLLLDRPPPGAAQTPAKLARNIRSMVAKGDTDYLILNVSNLREHVLGIAAAAALWQDPTGFDPDAFLADFARHGLDDAYRAFFDAWLEPVEHRVLSDGDVRVLGLQTLAKLEQNQAVMPSGFDRHGLPEAEAQAWQSARFGECIAKLEAVAATPLPAALTPPQREFYEANLRVQAAMLAGYYTWLQQLLASLAEPAHLAQAAAALERVIEVRRRIATGHWQHWYRGDTKSTRRGCWRGRKS